MQQSICAQSGQMLFNSLKQRVARSSRKDFKFWTLRFFPPQNSSCPSNINRYKVGPAENENQSFHPSSSRAFVSLNRLGLGNSERGQNMDQNQELRLKRKETTNPDGVWWKLNQPAVKMCFVMQSQQPLNFSSYLLCLKWLEWIIRWSLRKTDQRIQTKQSEGSCSSAATAVHTWELPSFPAVGGLSRSSLKKDCVSGLQPDWLFDFTQNFGSVKHLQPRYVSSQNPTLQHQNHNWP